MKNITNFFQLRNFGLAKVYEVFPKIFLKLLKDLFSTSFSKTALCAKREPGRLGHHVLTELIIVDRVSYRPLLKEDMRYLVMRGVSRCPDAGGPSPNDGYFKMFRHCYKSRAGLESGIY